ncbi:bacteriocin UviB [Fervidicella metallireducens AeB]|uniref:Bacteriocin UviB n=1 Tax=Fervidicella metallireducens AeB TaxID=1403537 RepID=A0A017RRU8_9CLOT|nr:BhlA/UviB family holin-like peptide [Fervidicella metallireducens]EYE87372.1 bacteriocin UviB [Fervidicella metallireducens AeB]
MENEIVKIASSQGIWAVLTVSLILYILKAQEKRDEKQEQRENNYQQIIINLTEKLNIITEVQKDIQEIKETISEKQKV